MNKCNLLRFLLMPNLESCPVTHALLFLMAFHVFSFPWCSYSFTCSLSPCWAHCFLFCSSLVLQLLCLTQSRLQWIVTEWMNEASHFSIRSLRFFFLPTRGIIIPILRVVMRFKYDNIHDSSAQDFLRTVKYGKRSGWHTTIKILWVCNGDSLLY